MLDQRAALDVQRERAAVGFALAILLWLKAMQLAVIPAERAETDQPRRIWLGLSSHGAVGRYPGIDAVRFPDLCQLLPRLLESQLLTQVLGFPSLFGLDRSQLRELLVKPLLADLQRGKTGVPACLAINYGIP